MHPHQDTLNRCREEWQRNAEADPLWAILCNEGRERGRWSEREFFETGRDEVDRVFGYMAAHGIGPAHPGRFLDFGCGVGRLSRALISRFASGVGLDIAPRMIELAAAYNASDPKSVEYRVNQDPDLRQIATGTIDFVYCHLVLQHMPPSLQEGFIEEFLRVLAPGGLSAFQIAAGKRVPIKRRLSSMLGPSLRRAGRKVLGLQRPEWSPGVSMQMHILEPATALAIAERAGCAVRATPHSNSTDTGHDGAIVFFDRREAIDRIKMKRTDSDLLSQFFFIQRPDQRDA